MTTATQSIRKALCKTIALLITSVAEIGLMAQNTPANGTVIDESGEYVIGASVM